jgi:phosphatidate cytidylyltransferase
LFIFVPMFLALAALQKNNSELVLLLLALIWSADSGAYFAGKAFGSNKLCPRVSPGKTVEGLIGGTVASVAAMLVYLELYIEPISAEQYLVYVALSVVISIASVVGDLFESLHKRLANAKDSGSLLPGHGGLFDRIDSLTSAAPIFYLMYYGALL